MSRPTRRQCDPDFLAGPPSPLTQRLVKEGLAPKPRVPEEPTYAGLQRVVCCPGGCIARADNLNVPRCVAYAHQDETDAVIAYLGITLRGPALKRPARTEDAA